MKVQKVASDNVSFMQYLVIPCLLLTVGIALKTLSFIAYMHIWLYAF